MHHFFISGPGVTNIQFVISQTHQYQYSQTLVSGHLRNQKKMSAQEKCSLFGGY